LYFLVKLEFLVNIIFIYFLKTNYYLFFIYFAFSEPSFQDLGYQFDVF